MLFAFLTYEMLLIPAGTFQMGESEGRHEVTLTEAYWMGKFEVTQALWKSLMGENPTATGHQFWNGEEHAACAVYHGDSAVGDDKPVTCISFLQSAEFANRLSMKDGLKPVYEIDGKDVRWREDANGYRIPTEAEWERAARGGLDTTYVGTSVPKEVCTYGNVRDASAAKLDITTDPFPCDDGVPQLATVGSYKANAYGLHDMIGNVLEFTWDWHAPYPDAPATDPRGPASAEKRVVRGGAWIGKVHKAKVSFRGVDAVDVGGRALGLRLARD